MPLLKFQPSYVNTHKRLSRNVLFQTFRVYIYIYICIYTHTHTCNWQHRSGLSPLCSHLAGSSQYRRSHITSLSLIYIVFRYRRSALLFPSNVLTKFSPDFFYFIHACYMPHTDYMFISFIALSVLN